ncbi:MAG: hypothetical protein AAFO07_11035, partial [Bacteroidota bacterium]
MRNLLPFYLCLISLLFWQCAPEQAPSDEKETTIEEESVSDELGTIYFKTSDDAAAQEAFEKGLLLLHSFEYADSRAFFLEAQELDADCAMAYWG